MINRVKIDGYDKFKNFVIKFNSSEPLILLFTGSKSADGISWCSDCVKAYPVINEVLEEITGKDFYFAEVAVGDRERWKNTACPFRTDNSLKLTSVPTLLVWGTEKRLNDNECQEKELVQLLFEDF